MYCRNLFGRKVKISLSVIWGDKKRVGKADKPNLLALHADLGKYNSMTHCAC